MKKHNRKSEGGNISDIHKSHGGGVSAKQIAAGKAAGVRHGKSPAELLATGHCEGRRVGQGAKSIGLGHPAGRRRFATGGHATNESNQRFMKARRRDEVLGSPHYAEGGKVHQAMRSVYEALHSHFENEPQMKKLGATKENVYEGEPHRYKRARGGRLWIQDAINPSKKGALHKTLGVPKGHKIP